MPWEDLMQRIKLVSTLSADPDAPNQSLLGLAAIAGELAAQGVSVKDLFAGTGARPAQMEDPSARISHRQRLAIYRNALALSKKTDIALLAGARQRLSDFGIYGYALVTSATFGEGLLLSLEHATMAGSAIKQISFRIERGTAILQSHGVASLGDLLPFVAEFWRSSMTSLFSKVLEAPFPATRMSFMYPPPPHWRRYERMFNCPVDFNSDVMEWHFDASILDRPCPNANPITTQVCQQFCDRVMAEGPIETDLIRQIRAACLNRPKHLPTAEEVASELGLSLRTMHRRLAESGLSYREIIDDVRRSVAIEFLENTRMKIDQVAERVGFADATSFRKAFRKWTGHSPRFFRSAGEADGIAG
jgi:AraC-like DNA-binding protein